MASKRSIWNLAGIPLLTVFFTVILFSGSGHAQMPVPKDFTLSQTKALGPVTFSHQKHVDKKLQCTACHVKVFQMKKGGTTKGKPMLMADMMKGQYCGACHNGKMAFAATDCMKCHAKK